MSAALNILARAGDVLHATHGEALTLRPSNVAATGYAQDVTATNSDPQSEGKGPPRFHVGEDLITHVVHIRRSELSNVTLSQVTYIEQTGTSKKYRVKHCKDDPNLSDVAFYCILS